MKSSKLNDEKILKRLSVLPSFSIKQTLKVMNFTALKVALVINKKKKFIGIITDGDIRRGLIKNISITEKIIKITNKKTRVTHQNINSNKAKKIMEVNKIDHLPILNRNRELVGLYLKEQLLIKNYLKNTVVIMAGGKGKRLRPLTYNTPKPMIKIDNKPILEHIILKLKKEKFNNFLISVNYLKKKIKSYFKLGQKLGVNIGYLEEKKSLGTIGSISLIKNKNNLPFIVCNGDVVSKVDAESILKFHNSHKSYATIGVVEYEEKNPFGVIKSKNFKFQGISEKPIKKYYVGAGIYVFNCSVTKFLKKNSKLDTPELLNILKKKKKKILVFPIHEDWRDIGNLKDLKSKLKIA